MSLASLELVELTPRPSNSKTTLARRLAAALDCKHLDMDSMLWKDDWVQVERSVMAEMVKTAAEDESWVSDGVYLSLKASFYGRATDIICE